MQVATGINSCAYIGSEALIKRFLVRLSDEAESLAQQAVELDVSALLTTALHDHIAELTLESAREIKISIVVTRIVHNRSRAI